MLDQRLTLPDDPEELRRFTARLLAEVTAQAILIEKLRHQLAGHRAHRFGASSETAEQLQPALESEPLRRHWFKPNGERDRRRRDDRADASSGQRGEGQTQAPSDPGPHPKDGGRADPKRRGLRGLAPISPDTQAVAV
jgi:hypothetical protein